MIVIGDVHGEFNTLMKLIDILPQTNDICFVGDLIDRGPDSKKVVELVRKNKYSCVVGNHEAMATSDSEYIQETWMMNGALSTLDSYGGLSKFTLHNDYTWMKTLPYMIEIVIKDKNYLISHSFCWEGENTSVDDILWGRCFEVDKCKITNIFGHTPQKEVFKLHNKHWCIDTGCTFGRKLSAIDLKTEKVYSVLKGAQ